MPLITVAISDGEGEGDEEGDGDSRLAVKNASQDITLCALCNASNRGNVNPTYVQYFPLPPSSIVRRDSPQRLSVCESPFYTQLHYLSFN